MTPAHDQIDVAFDNGPWEFPIEVWITAEQVAVLPTPEQEVQLAEIADELSYPPTLEPGP